MERSAKNMVKIQAEKMKRTIDSVVGMLNQNIGTYFQTYEDEIDKETSEVDTKSGELQDFKIIVLQEIEDGSDHDIISNYKGFLEDRGMIVVAGNQHPNPDYKSKLANVYCEGSINVAQLKSMIGTLAEKAIELPKSISEEEEIDRLNVLPEFELEDVEEVKMADSPQPQ